mmetsp:Transcript_41391/g.163020  ORF Transcript_41391/g.163020 Transcript_41391/m.163020 type:complete len:254 (-) Transcript_41391:277-1038(-)
MLAGALLVNEDSGGLDDNVDAELLPRQLKGVPAADNLDRLAVHGDLIITGDLDISVKGAEDGVVLEEMGSGLNAGGVVDGNNLQVNATLGKCAQKFKTVCNLVAITHLHLAVGTSLQASDEVAPDTSETVDGNLDRHRRSGPRGLGGLHGGGVESIGLNHSPEGSTLPSRLKSPHAVQRPHADKLGHAASRRRGDSADGSSRERSNKSHLLLSEITNSNSNTTSDLPFPLSNGCSSSRPLRPKSQLPLLYIYI